MQQNNYEIIENVVIARQNRIKYNAPIGQFTEILNGYDPLFRKLTHGSKLNTRVGLLRRLSLLENMVKNN